MLLSTTLEVQSSCNPLLVMFSRNSREGISQIIQASFCSSTMPRSWSTPIVAHQRLWLLFLCTPGSQSMLLPSCPQHHLYSVHGSRPCSSDCPRMANYSCSSSSVLFLMAAHSDCVPPSELELQGRLLLSYSAWSSIENMCSPGLGFTRASSDTVSSCMGFHLSPASSSARLLLHMWCFSETSFPNYRVGLEQEFSMYEEKLRVEIGHPWTLENCKFLALLKITRTLVNCKSKFCVKSHRIKIL